MTDDNPDHPGKIHLTEREELEDHAKECIGADKLHVAIYSDVEIPDATFCMFCGREIHILEES